MDITWNDPDSVANFWQNLAELTVTITMHGDEQADDCIDRFDVTVLDVGTGPHGDVEITCRLHPIIPTCDGIEPVDDDTPFGDIGALVTINTERIKAVEVY